MMRNPYADCKLILLPPQNKEDLWFGYATSDEGEIELADQTRSAGATPGECAKNVYAALRYELSMKKANK